MKSVYELLRQKESEMQRLERELEALRITAKLLESENAKAVAAPRPAAPQAPAVAPQAPTPGTYSAVHADLVQPPANYVTVKAAAGPAPAAAPAAPVVPARVTESTPEAAVPKNYWP